MLLCSGIGGKAFINALHRFEQEDVWPPCLLYSWLAFALNASRRQIDGRRDQASLLHVSGYISAHGCIKLCNVARAATPRAPRLRMRLFVSLAAARCGRCRVPKRDRRKGDRCRVTKSFTSEPADSDTNPGSTDFCIRVRNFTI